MNNISKGKATILVVEKCIGKKEQNKSKCQGLLFKKIQRFTNHQMPTVPQSPNGVTLTQNVGFDSLPALLSGQQAFLRWSI